MPSTVLGTGKQQRTRQMKFWVDWSAVLVTEDILNWQFQPT